MNDVRNTRQLIYARLLTASGIPSRAFVISENVPFPRQPSAQTFVTLTMDVTSERKTATALAMAEGIATITVYVPRDSSTATAEDLSLAIRNAFEPGISLGAAVQVYRTEPGSGRAVDDHLYALPIYVYWRTFAAVST